MVPPFGALWRPADPGTETVHTSIFRALAVLRVVAVANTVGLFVYRGLTAGAGPWTNWRHPVAAAVVVAALVVWTGVAVWAYDRASRRRPALLLTDLAVTVGAVAITPLVKGMTVQATLPGFWVMVVVLAWGVRGSWGGGLVAAVAVALADLGVRDDVDQSNYGNLFLLLVGGPVVGYASGLVTRILAERDAAERAAAAAAERARLARAVHDGVLQVLALVQRRGSEMGGEAAELGRLAGEQEVALRALVQDRAGSAPSAARSPVGEVDLVAAVTPMAGRLVTVSAPSAEVLLPADVVAELVAAVRACLDNVRIHVGADAPVWVLVEDLGSTVVLSVRDEGPGIESGRLELAREEGRLGVSQSVLGRLADLGGSAEVVTGPGQGTEWELTVPRPVPGAVVGTDDSAAGRRAGSRSGSEASP